MKHAKRATSLLTAFFLLLTPALALAVDVDIDTGSISVGEATYSQDNGAQNADHGGSVNVTSTSGSTSNSITVDIPTGGNVDVSVTGVDFTGYDTAITVEGGGTADIALTDVTVTLGDAAPGIAVTDGSTANIDVNGTNTVTSPGAALAIDGSTVNVTGDTAGDKLHLTGESDTGTVDGSGSAELSVSGTATVVAASTAENTEPMQDVAVTGAQSTTVSNSRKTTKVTAPAPPSDPAPDPDPAPSPKKVEIPTVDELKAMSPEDVAKLTPAQIKALTATHIQALTEAQIKALTATQVKALTVKQIGWLMAVEDYLSMVHGIEEHASVLSKAQVEAIYEAYLQFFSIPHLMELLPSLTDSQIAFLPAWFFDALNDTQRLALPDAVVQKLHPVTLEYMSINTLMTLLPRLTGEQIGKMDVEYFSNNCRTDAQIGALVDAMNTNQRSALTGKQWAAIGARMHLSNRAADAVNNGTLSGGADTPVVKNGTAPVGEDAPTGVSSGVAPSGEDVPVAKNGTAPVGEDTPTGVSSGVAPGGADVPVAKDGTTLGGATVPAR